eukprot:gene23370-biopygen10330
MHLGCNRCATDMQLPRTCRTRPVHTPCTLHAHYMHMPPQLPRSCPAPAPLPPSYCHAPALCPPGSEFVKSRNSAKMWRSASIAFRILTLSPLCWWPCCEGTHAGCIAQVNHSMNFQREYLAFSVTGSAPGGDADDGLCVGGAGGLCRHPTWSPPTPARYPPTPPL